MYERKKLEFVGVWSFKKNVFVYERKKKKNKYKLQR